MNGSLSPMLTNFHNPSQDLYLQGLRGSSKALLVAYLEHFNAAPLVVVTESFEKAEQLQEDLAFFMGREGIYFFPHWDTFPYDNFSPHRGIVAQRFQALRALCQGRARVLITTPMALMQRMMPKALFEKSCFTLQCGKASLRPWALNQIKQAGYTLTEVVEERGEYSLREEIIDLFPLNTEQPLRLEWQGAALASIKTFDVQTQLSLGETWEMAEILPAQEVLLTQEAHAHALKMLKATLPAASPLFKQTQVLLQKKAHFPGMESLMGLFYPNSATLFDYWEPEAFLILDEPPTLQEKARALYEEIFAEYELSRQQDNFVITPEKLFLSHQDLHLAFKKFLTVNLAEHAPPHTNLNPPPGSPVHEIPFLANHTLRTEGQERLSDTAQELHSSVAQMIDKVQHWKQSGATVVFTAKNQTHADHLKELLADFSIEAAPAVPGTTNWAEWLQAGLVLPGAVQPHVIAVGALSAGFRMVNEAGKIQFALLTAEEIFGEKIRNRRWSQNKIQQFVGNLEDLREGDYVVHLDYGIGQYQGLEKKSIYGQQTDFMVLTYARNEKVFIPVDKFHLVQKYINADGSAPRLNKLGEKSWKKTKSKVTKAVEDMSEELVAIYAARQAKEGFRYSPDTSMMKEFELAFPYEETEDQLTVIEEVKQDLEATTPMDRLVCGDVGFGKTEIAIRAAFKAVADGKQVCVLVPTTILAQQHLASFSSRLAGMPVMIDVMSRFRTPSEQRETLKKLAEGKVDILIGTHRLLSADVKFRDLGLLIVDEEQRFGVRHKEKIKQFRAQVDVLTLSATPIPRTLYMSMMGIRDFSLISSPPPDRLAVRTRCLKSSDHIIQEAVSRETRRNGQVFIVHNRVETIYEYTSYLKSILKDVRLAVVHGQMGERELEKIMLNFIEGEYDVLVSTTIIESGLDIPRANTILVNNAHQFGLSQLYQLRGRVGRSNLQAYAYLLVPPDKILTNVAESRLKVLQEFNDLGVGFKIASRDLELRGAGNLLGGEQSGHIASVGMELYTQLIENAVKKLQQEQKSLLQAEEIKVRFDLAMTIPEEYIQSPNQRLSLYKKLAAVENEAELWKLRDGIENRFGLLPDPLLNLFKSVQARLLGQRYAFKLIEHRNEQLTVQMAQTAQLNTEKLVHWLQMPQSPLKFIPENTLMLTPVPNSMNAILEKLRSFESLFGG